MRVYLIVLLALAVTILPACKKVESPASEQADPAVASEGAPPPRKRIPIPGDHIRLPKGHSSAGWEQEKYVELLCDPKAHRLSININPPEFRPNHGFPERRILEIEDYIFSGGAFRGDQGFERPLMGYEPCGDYVLAIAGEKFNWNGRGRAGGVPGFVTIRIDNDFQTVFPGSDYEYLGIGKGVALTTEWISAPEEIALDRLGCPISFASRIDAFPDMKAKKTRVDIFVQAPNQQAMEYPLIKAMDYTVCNETIMGRRTPIIRWQQRENDGDL